MQTGQVSGLTTASLMASCAERMARHTAVRQAERPVALTIMLPVMFSTDDVLKG